MKAQRRALIFLLLAACAASATAGAPRRIQLADPALAADHDSRLRLRYLVECALPADVIVESGAGPAHHEFAGSMGLAPDWSSRALTAEESRWVAACMLARMNYFGVPVHISMRARHAPGGHLEADAAERAQYPLHEGAFFGDVFADDAPAYACSGAAVPGREQRLRAQKRICTIPDGRTTADGRALSACGFIVAGPCAAKPFRQEGVDYSGQVIDVYLPP